MFLRCFFCFAACFFPLLLPITSLTLAWISSRRCLIFFLIDLRMVAVGLRCVCLLRGMERWLAVFCEGLSVLVLLVVLLVVLLHGMHVGVSVVGLFGLADLLGVGVVPVLEPLDACALAA
jgi:hypothetical protein